MKRLLLLITIVFCIGAKAQIITTVVGGGGCGSNYCGDGGPATAANLYYPFAGTFDLQGNMYIVDAGNECIRKVNTAGIITTIAGNGTLGYTGDGGPATAATFYEPIAIAIDAVGNIYVSDDQNNVIRVINTAGIINTFAGNGVAGYSGDGGPASVAQLNSQNGIAFDAMGNLYIADGSNNRIRMVNTAGIITTVAGTGITGYSGDGGQATAANIDNPAGIVIDAIGNLYIADQTNNRIRMVNTAGIITTIVGTGSSGYSGDGGQATAAELYWPFGLTLDINSNLYIADNYNHCIRKVNTAGIITTLAGIETAGYNGDNGQANAAKLYYPSGVFLNAVGDLFIADQDNFRIRKVTNVIPDTNEAGISSIVITSACNDSIVSATTTIRNYGTNILTSCMLNYQIDNGSVQTYVWNGSLTSGQTTIVNLPNFIAAIGNHTLLCYCSNPNNATSSTFEIIQSKISFSIAFGVGLPLTEGFETSTCPSGMLPNSNWNISHTSTSGIDFTITSAASATGSQSSMLNNLNNVGGDTSILQTVSYYDLATLTTPSLTFKAAYQQKATTNADKLQIFTSTDCGNSWQSRKVISSTTLASLAGGTGTSAYIPTPSQFTTYTVPITAVASSHNVMFRWEFIADPSNPGNNLYIDDINVSSNVAGIEQYTNNNEQVNIYPNPTTGMLNVEGLGLNGIASLSITDLLGNTVIQHSAFNTQNKQVIDASSLNEGVYNISISSDDGVVNKRLVIVR